MCYLTIIYPHQITVHAYLHLEDSQSVLKLEFPKIIFKHTNDSYVRNNTHHQFSLFKHLLVYYHDFATVRQQQCLPFYRSDKRLIECQHLGTLARSLHCNLKKVQQRGII